MPPPQMFPCGGEGQPACPPTPALDPRENALNVLDWWEKLSGDEQVLFLKSLHWSLDEQPTEEDV